MYHQAHKNALYSLKQVVLGNHMERYAREIDTRQGRPPSRSQDLPAKPLMRRKAAGDSSRCLTFLSVVFLSFYVLFKQFKRLERTKKSKSMLDKHRQLY